MGRGGTRRSSGRAGAATRRGGARWLVVWALAAVVTALGGCRASGAGGGEESARGARVIYESEGTVCAVKPSGADGRDQVLVWEWFSPEVLSVDERYGHLIPGDGGVLRVVHLDLARGKARAKRQWPSHSPGEMLPLGLAVSRDGRRTAMLGGDGEDPCSLAGSVFVLDGGWRWVPVIRFEERWRFGLEWSPDGSALAYISIAAEHTERGGLALDAVALPVPRPAGPAEETMLTAGEAGSHEVEWAADGQAVYHVVQDASGFSLEAVAWPSLERRTVKRADASLLQLSVARSSGDVVFLEKVTGEPKPEGEGPSEGESEFVVWRIPPGGEADGTGVRLSSAPRAAAVSPDGKRLLVIPRAETEQRFPMHGTGLALHSLADGGSRSFRE
ncbi:MAG: hypothetical protein JSV79_03260, partial [Armatimonadota bacterium]